MDNVFERHAISANPLPFIFHYDRVCDAENYTWPNWHINIELLFLKNGSGKISLGKQKLDVSEGDIVIINSNIPHSFYSERGMEYYCLIPDNSFCRFNGIETDTTKFISLVRNDETAAKLFGDVVSEFTGTMLCRAAGICSSVLSLILYLARNYTENSSSEAPTSTEEGVRLAVSYICANFGEKISVDELSTLSGFSKYYFMREFKRIIGDTPIVFLNRIRCENAKCLLRSGTQSIREISEQCGFEDLAYFSKTFKHYCGISPGKYVKELNNSDKE